ncbi:MAG: hypothetical protein WAN94_00635 [Pseudolabrys sp.]
MPFAAALLGHGILLTHGNRDVVGDIAQLLDSGRDFIDGLNRSWRRVFDRHDVPRDFLGGLAGLWGKAFDLLGHHRETTAGFAGTRGLYCRVEGKQICLRGNAADEVADFADFVNRCGEAFYGIGNCLCWLLGSRLSPNLRRGLRYVRSIGRFPRRPSRLFRHSLSLVPTLRGARACS